MLQTDKELLEIAKKCKQASRRVARLSTAVKDEALHAMAAQLEKDRELIFAANAIDVKNGKDKNLSPAMIDRLVLNDLRISGMAGALRDVASFHDPVGEMSDIRTRPNGIQVGKRRIPLGVICIIYESRPNVTSDAAGLCLKAGNAVLLRGGSEAFHSNKAIVESLHKALKTTGIPPEAIFFVPTTDRSALTGLLKCDDYIDLVIPRGGEGLIRFVAENSRIPVIKHYKGVCHLYVDKDANEEMAINLLLDGKTSRPGVCNALETMLVHQDVAETFLPKAAVVLRKKGVEMRGCTATRNILPEVAEATEEDYYAEYLSLIIAVKVVKNYEEAVNHIEKYGSEHTDVIVTDSLKTSQVFIRDVNSSVVAVNASSRFSDGGELGLGAEIGISTTKLHAFGPMGLEALTTRKFVVTGDGQTRHDIKW